MRTRGNLVPRNAAEHALGGPRVRERRPAQQPTASLCMSFCVAPSREASRDPRNGSEDYAHWRASGNHDAVLGSRHALFYSIKHTHGGLAPMHNAERMRGVLSDLGSNSDSTSDPSHGFTQAAWPAPLLLPCLRRGITRPSNPRCGAG